MKCIKVLSITIWIFFVIAGAGAAHGFDPSGNYDFVLSDSETSGPCPMGGPGKGTLTIKKSGAGFTITYVKGMICRPASVCVLPGSCSGNKCSFTTTVGVDNEGGKVTNKAELAFDKNHALGSGGSVYQHPGGMRCEWTYLLTLTRKP